MAAVVHFRPLPVSQAVGATLGPDEDFLRGRHRSLNGPLQFHKGEPGACAGGSWVGVYQLAMAGLPKITFSKEADTACVVSACFAGDG